MGRLLTAGFESGLVNEELAADTLPTIGSSGTPAAQTAKVKNGSYALKLPAGDWVTATFADYDGPYYFKFWFKRVSIDTHADSPFWRADAGGFGHHARLLLLSSGKIREQHNNGTSGQVDGTAVLADDTWYEIRVEYFGNNTTGYVKVWVNGSLDIDDTSIDTQSSVGAQGKFQYGGTALAYDFYYDDMFINDDQGSDNNTHIDDGTELTYFSPITDGVTSAFVPDPSTANHYENVDEIPYSLAPANDSLDGGAVNDVELLVTSDVTPVITVDADVKNINILTATWFEAGSTIRALLRVGGANYNGPADLANQGANVGVHSNRWMTNPDTAAAWTASEVDSIEIGAIITAATTNDGEIHAIGLYVENIPPNQVDITFDVKGKIDVGTDATFGAKGKVAGELGIHRIRVGVHYSSVGLQVRPVIRGPVS